MNNKNYKIEVIESFKGYAKEFSSEPIQSKALENALNIRKFEIELYWKRTTYFWSLIVICFTGYFSLLGKDPSSSFLISFLGLILSFAWVLANKGSKYWQKNWESHVDHLQCKTMGPLYRTVLGYNENKKLFSTSAYPFSVSRINLGISIIVSFTWLLIFLRSFIAGIYNASDMFVKMQYFVLLMFAIASIWYLYKWSLPKKIDFKKTNFIKILFENE